MKKIEGEGRVVEWAERGGGGGGVHPKVHMTRRDDAASPGEPSPMLVDSICIIKLQ